MEILALYFPKPSEFAESITQLIVAYLVLCAMAFRLKLSVPIAAVAMAAGGFLAVARDLYRLLHEPSSFGPMARKLSGTNYSDAFFEITAYLHVGRGKILFVIGMGVALVLYAVIVDVRARRQSR